MLTDTLKNLSDNFNKIKQQEITLLIEDSRTQETLLIADNAKLSRNKYKIVIGAYSDKFIEEDYQVYFCSNTKELEEIVLFMTNHIDIFVSKKTDDVLDQEDTISLDSLTDEEMEKILSDADIY